MSDAFIDTSFLLAIVFEEREASRLRRLLTRYDQIFASDLLVSETASAVAREGSDGVLVRAELDRLSLVFPHRSLEPEFMEALGSGYLRGADLWHLGCALFVAGKARGELAFLSRDGAQRRAARALGFPTP